MTIPEKPNSPDQKYRLSQNGEDFKKYYYHNDTDHDTHHDTDYDTDHDTDHVDELICNIIMVLVNEKSRSELMALLDLKHAGNFRDNYMKPSMDKGYIEMTLPDTPKSKNQKYRLTAKGQKIKIQLEKKL